MSKLLTERQKVVKGYRTEYLSDSPLRERMERLSQSFGGRLGRLILGDTPQSPAQGAARTDQGSARASVGVGERLAPQPAERLMSMMGSPVYEGVPVAQRPRHQQISCMTCNQALEPEQRQLKCHVCSSWIHDSCIETLQIGSKWNADV